LGAWRLHAAVGALLLALASAGCSMSFPIASLLPGAGDEAPAVPKSTVAKGAVGEGATGSLAVRPASEAEAMSSTDWSLAKSALREALAREGDASIPWQNPSTGARGTVTPIASAYTEDGFACRNFLASRVHDGRESWLEGVACRLHRGAWDVKSARPLRES
jgi:surface antigen